MCWDRGEMALKAFEASSDDLNIYPACQQAGDWVRLFY
jgi:hypothetical protein